MSMWGWNEAGERETESLCNALEQQLATGNANHGGDFLKQGIAIKEQMLTQTCVDDKDEPLFLYGPFKSRNKGGAGDEN